MAEAIPTVLALVATALIAVALWAMTVGDLRVAGLSFLSASVVIYLRETQVQDE